MSQPIEIRPADRLRWQRLLTEALQRGLDIHVVLATNPTVGPAWAKCFVSSHSAAGTTHEVAVGRNTTGDVQAWCDCRSGDFTAPCTHIALAADEARMWPLGMVIVRQAMLPDTETRWEFRITEWVLVRGTSRRGVVSGISVHEGRPWYRVDDPNAHATLGHYFSYELVPTAKPRHKPKVDQTAGLALLTKGGGA